MQPPTPYSRTTFPIPSPSRRPRHSTSSSNLRSSSVPTSLPRLLTAAAAVTSSRTWVLHDVENTGGVDMLVLALFAGRIYREVIDRRRDRKGKKKEIAGGEVLSVTQLLSATALSVQAITFFSAVKTIGPLRGSLLSIAASIVSSLTKDDPGKNRQPLPFLPAILASAFMLFDAHKLHGPECLLNLFTLVALTLFLCGPWSGTLEIKNRSGRSPGTGGRLGRLVMTLAASSMCLLGLIYTNTLPSPHHMLNLPLHHLVLPLMTAALAAYTPLPFATTYDPKPAARFRTPRDYTVYLFAIVVLQFFALHPIPSAIDVMVLLPLVLTTVYTVPRLNEPISTRTTVSKDYRPVSITPSCGKWSYWNMIPAAWKPHFQTILHTDSSRKIFYFLLVNLAYMGVQMGYGVMTNSLGLISDAIHMFFDCLGIGVGLWASVAATWKPDGRYTFGYSRVETLSGFANGLFLILISIFIIFEAIQRIIDPPEMETRQLLLVSSIGLGINLFGMWATGGHHHHGHGHSHGHDHGHGHSHAHIHHKKEDHMHGDHHHAIHSHGTHKEFNGPRILNEQTVSLSHARRRSSGKDAKEISLKHLSNGHDKHDHAHHHGTGHSDCHHDHHDHHDHHEHEHTHAHEHDHKDNHNHDHDDAPSHSHNHDHVHNHSNHSHSHAHSHNMRGVFLHVMADTLGSVGVIISTIMINLTGWTIFDPIASLFIAVLIMASVVPLVIDSGRVLCLDVGAKADKEIQAALGDLSNVEGLANYSAPRFWPRCEGELVGSIHIQLSLSPSAYDPTRISTPASNKGHHHAIYANAEKVVGRVEKVLKGKIRGLEELVIQVEGSEERVFCDCMTGG